jgi:2-polyprenyl-3-methyl-5-hydroxy-6-metoxy-1,4-benzoquinol methylase
MNKTVPMKDIPDYSEKSGKYFKHGRIEMLPFIPRDATKILEIGCGVGEFAANLKSVRGVHITGIEPFEAAANIATSRLDRVLVADANAGIVELQGNRFDCIVCNDVLEHLVDPWDTLKHLRPLLAPNGKLVASIPNIRYMPVLKGLVLKGEWRYVEQGVMDRTHLRFFTKKSIYALFEESGYKVTHVQGINAIKFPWKFGLLNKLLLGELVDTKFPQFACVVE